MAGNSRADDNGIIFYHLSGRLGHFMNAKTHSMMKWRPGIDKKIAITHPNPAFWAMRKHGKKVISQIIKIITKCMLLAILQILFSAHLRWDFSFCQSNKLRLCGNV